MCEETLGKCQEVWEINHETGWTLMWCEFIKSFIQKIGKEAETFCPYCEEENTTIELRADGENSSKNNGLKSRQRNDGRQTSVEGGSRNSPRLHGDK